MGCMANTVTTRRKSTAHLKIVLNLYLKLFILNCFSFFSTSVVTIDEIGGPSTWFLLYHRPSLFQHFQLCIGRPCFMQSNTRGLFVWIYQPAYQLESTIFFSYNKSDSVGLCTGFNTSRTGHWIPISNLHLSKNIKTQGRFYMSVYIFMLLSFPLWNHTCPFVTLKACLLTSMYRTS